MPLIKPVIIIALAVAAVAAGWLLGSSVKSSDTTAASASAAAQRPVSPPAGGSIPAIELPDLDGEAVDLQQFEGRPVVVNLWATWCPPCRREMPVLEQAAAENPDVAFVFANQAESAELVRDFLDGEGLALDNVLLDADSEVARHFQARALPTTLFFGSDGELSDVHLGEVSRAQLSDYLRETN